ncbi:methyltransferase domain-containing protein [Desulfolutivibrio sulfoxidireducens]|uniref:methyltransferase domain-containing protein n=1 Tax=Desulfolutivibrio sulfoxidireducens TaxID=2773299 RepID=UPI00159E69EF|nr:class I SAM-dependent methyltransferase [Desulfolutivibrio sulfoxidireducens]QLA20287.1 methyltransferase domain-containing protein [Desulfolutivibrio sulfoxidireducens]
MNGDDAKARAVILARVVDREPIRRQGEAWVFLDAPAASSAASRSAFDALRERLKGLGSLYPLLVAIFSPVLPSRAYTRALAATLARHAPGAAVLNLGSGPGRTLRRKDVVNVDMFPLPGVDMAADLASLPIRSGSVDLALSIAVLEHVPDPGRLGAEMVRILRPGGEIVCFVPFLQPFHAAPDDYSRLTLPGLRHLFQGLEIVSTGIGSGPVSALLWTAQHVAAMLLSLGSSRAYFLLLPLVMVATWPVKFLDFFLERHPRAADAAGGFFLVAKKP